MSSLMTTIEVDRNAAVILQSLKDKAEIQGVSLGELLQILADDGSVTTESPEQAPRNEAMLKALRETRELLKNQPVRNSLDEAFGVRRL